MQAVALHLGYECLRGGKKFVCKCNRGKSGTKGVPVKTAYARYDIKNVSEFMKAEGYKGRKGADFNVMLVKRILDKENFYKGSYNYGGIESVGEYEPIQQGTQKIFWSYNEGEQFRIITLTGKA